MRLVASGRRWYLLTFDLRATGARAQHRSPPAADVEEFLRTQVMAMAPTFRADVTLRAPRQAIAIRLGDRLGDGTLTG